MPRFAPKSYQQIIASMIAKMVARTALSDISDTSVAKQILAAAAQEDAEIYFSMTLLLDLFSIDTATGEDLDARAAEIQPATITRNEAVKATGNVVFFRTGTTGTTAIAAGTKVKTAGGEEFVTTAAGSITAVSPVLISGHSVGQDSGLVPVVAAAGGAAGNVASQTIIAFATKPSGVDGVINLSPTINGADQESDDAFRARLKEYIAGLSRSTVSGLESGVLGLQDETTGATILFAKTVEDPLSPGTATLYIDDGTGSAQTSEDVRGTELTATYTWAGTTTVTSADTSEVSVGDWIGLVSDGQLFEVTGITPGVSVTIANPGSLTIPTGATTSRKNMECVTEGLAGPPADTAVGGEEYLALQYGAIHSAAGYALFSSERGVLTEGTDYYLDRASGQINFVTALVAGEAVFAEYERFTGLIALAQLVVDGDPDDRATYPGLRAAGVQVTVLVPSVLVQNVTASLVVAAGYEEASVIAAVEDAIKAYINGLGISGDVVRNQLIAQIMAVAGVSNCTLTAPAADVVLLDDQLARTTDANVTVT